MSTTFRAMMIQAHHEGERARALRVAEAFRGINRCLVYHKTANNARRVTLWQLGSWMGKEPNKGPLGQTNFYSFLETYEHAFNKLKIHGFILWGEYDPNNNRWEHPRSYDANVGIVMFQMTPEGSEFLRECKDDHDIIRFMGLHK